MPRTIHRACLAAILVCFSTAALALDLYTGEVPVKDQSARERGAAMSEALAQVLVKVSGDPDAAAAPGVADRLSGAASLVQQFQYRTVKRPTVDPDQPDETVLLLSARFDPSMVENVLGEAGLPRWGEQRPTLLIWLVRQEQEGRELVALGDPVIADAIQRAADRRGLPVLFPLLDLVDQQAVPVREVWGGFTEPLKQASERYGTDTFLLGRLSGGQGDWQARWTVFDQGREDYHENSGADPRDVVSEGVNFAANVLGARYAVPIAEQSATQVTVAVDGVRSMDDYNRLMDYLNRLTIVKRAEPVATEDDRLTLQLSLLAGLDRFDQIIAIGEVLQPANNEDVSATPLSGPAYHRRYTLRQ